MIAFIARRLAASVALLFLVLTLTFFFIQLAPGDPTAVFIDPRVPPAYRAELVRLFGLDRPLPVQYLSWLRAVVLEFDWGVSFSHGRPVTAVLASRMPATLLLAVAALLVQYVAGLLSGVAAARRAGGAGDHLIRSVSLVLYSLPAFWLGLMALLLLSHLWPLFPPGQMRSVGAEALSPAARLLDRLHHLALPSLVLGLAGAGGITRFVRNQLLEVLHEDYIRTARAKGARETAVLWIHALRNAAAPAVQLLGLSLPALLSGALVVEVVFSWPGMGRLTYGAVLSRDYPLILAATGFSGALVVAGNLAADVVHAVVDPRVRDAI